VEQEHLAKASLVVMAGFHIHLHTQQQEVVEQEQLVAMQHLQVVEVVVLVFLHLLLDYQFLGQAAVAVELRD
jgi:hypothetical protein